MTSRESCQFIPPYLIDQLAGTDNAELGRCATQTQRLDAALVARRETRPSHLAGVGSDEDGSKVIYSANNTESLPGTKVRADGAPPTGDDAVDEAYDSTGQIYQLFADHFGRASINGDDSTVTVTVHYGTDYDNAFWDGKELVFGDGDGKVFGRFTKPPDILYHEFTHGVTQFTAGLTYKNQSGALNESVSDCFASMGKQWLNGQSVDEADWLIGAGLFLPDIHARALRSLKAPGTAYDDPRIGKDPQVSSMSDYVDTSEDNGGVHINSGIPNHAFYLAATSIGGNSWEGAGRAWYAALTGGEVTADTDFAGFARATVSAAQRVFGDDSAEAAAVRAAWDEVGVGLRAGPPHDNTDGEPAGAIVVRRTGGIAAVVREASIDLASSSYASQVSDLLSNVARAGTSEPQPDRFSYTFVVSGRRIVVGEQDLTPELRRVVDLVLGD